MGEKQDKLNKELNRFMSRLEEPGFAELGCEMTFAYRLGEAKGIARNIELLYLPQALAERAEEERQALHDDGWRAPGEKG